MNILLNKKQIDILINEQFFRSFFKKIHKAKPNMKQVANSVTSAGKTRIPSKTISLKPVLGSGSDHVVYASKLHPDKLFKVELREGEIDVWYNLFKKYPDIFPKIYNRGKLTNPDGVVVSFVTIEKLNVGPFHQLWDEMNGGFQHFQRDLPYKEQISLQYVSYNYKEPYVKNKWMAFLKEIKKEQPNLFPKIKEFTNLMEKLHTFAVKPDIRKYNLGYDNNGILKCLDI